MPTDERLAAWLDQMSEILVQTQDLVIRYSMTTILTKLQRSQTLQELGFGGAEGIHASTQTAAIIALAEALRAVPRVLYSHPILGPMLASRLAEQAMVVAGRVSEARKEREIVTFVTDESEQFVTEALIHRIKNLEAENRDLRRLLDGSQILADEFARAFMEAIDDDGEEE